LEFLVEFGDEWGLVFRVTMDAVEIMNSHWLEITSGL
jgi:hypothetical protein